MIKVELVVSSPHQLQKKTFENNDKSLKKLAIKANEKIKDEMISRGININKKINLCSTSASVVRINDNSIELLQLGDSLILIIYRDNSYKLLVQNYDHDEETLTMWKELAQKKVKDIRKELNTQIIKVREGMNINYGILNGENTMRDFLNYGSLKLKNVKHILLFTDGLFIPKENHKDDDDFDRFVDIFMKGGLEENKNYVRSLENKDPDCWIYPRFKPHDDIAAISITFDN